VADRIKPDSAEASRQMKKQGLHVVMLTGDNERTASAIQKQLGLNKVIAGVLPQGKEQEVVKLQQSGKTVAMVGDGINDSPALARADVGIAIGAGTDVAIESADIVLMKNDLNDVVTSIELSKAVMRNIRQNLFWAFFYNVIGIPLAAGCFYSLLGIKLNPMIGAAAMSLSSFCVCSNALRLRLFRPKHVVSTPAAAPSVLRMDPEVPDLLPEESSKNRKEENEEMQKIVFIEGMMCPNCQRHCSEALNGIEGCKAEVLLEENLAKVSCDPSVTDEMIAKAVENAGYKVTKIL
jgi:Cu+-exporting ATPase